MHRLRFLQLGDIHLNAEAAKPTLIDWKDKGFPPALGAAVCPRPGLQQSLRAASQQLDIDSILICGDITDRGNVEYYTKGVQTLIDLLNLKSAERNSMTQCVPGNHDLKLPLAEGAKDLLEKFVPLEAIWAKEGVPVLAGTTMRSTLLRRGGCNARVISLNSCIGCGELRSFPDGIRSEITSALHASSETLHREQLNTPAFLEGHLEQLAMELESVDDPAVGIILAHHNLLPQALPRVEIYTELLNGGLLRDRLNRSRPPIIYCHGHIHTDPVELFHYPTGTIVVSVSAPLLKDGFNIVEVHIGNRGFPLGCEVSAFRATPTGLIQEDKRKLVRVPLVSSKRFHEVTDPLLDRVVQRLPEGHHTYRDSKTH